MNVIYEVNYISIISINWQRKFAIKLLQLNIILARLDNSGRFTFFLMYFRLRPRTFYLHNYNGN